VGSRRIAQKPSYSKVSITQTGNSFELCVPPVGFHPAMFVILGFAIFWNGFMFVWTIGVSQAPFPVNIPFMLFSLPFWAVGLFLAYGLLFCVYGHTYLYMDRQVVNFTQKMFGYRVRKQKPILTHEVYKLILISRHWTKDSDGDRQEQPSELRIEGGGQKISLGGQGGGIEDEATIDWIAYEVSEWLDKPLEVIN
jgi:membrane protein implicated in regulation of membrane protease activity